MSITSLGYVGFRVRDPGAWSAFATEVLGVMESQPSGLGRRFRVDQQAWRLALEEGRDYVPRILRAGISGPIDTTLGRFNGAMPGFAQLSDAEAAQLANYVLGALNASVLPAGFVPYTAEEVAALKAKPASAPENRKLRERLDAALKAR